MNENLVNLVRLLQFHDWHYEFSDDHRVWKRGTDERNAINQEQKRLISNGLATEEEVQKLTQKYAPKT
jgi:hypothetical protein